MTKVAVITGVSGQDGSYLCELLLEKDYKVVGIVRRSSSPNRDRLHSVLSHPNLSLREADMSDTTSIRDVLQEIADYDRIEVYNLAAQSHVHTSFRQPEYTADVDAIGPLRILETIRTLGLTKKARVYQASTSELFGKVAECPQTETTPFYPRSPYAVAKLYAYWIIRNYRESYGMFACNGILFNHESERRGEEFVTRKITKGIARTRNDPSFVLTVGNLNARRDWGYAPDYVRGMWLMMQQEDPRDYVLATGELHTVREFIETAFQHVGTTIAWSGKGLDEQGVDAETGRVLVRVNPEFYRPSEVDLLLGDYTRAREELGWTPRVSFRDLVARMANHDCASVERSGEYA
jgi:GDPmannose 4,6-dehydratase